MEECTYGLVKRIEFITEKIEKYNPSTVLDVGCGTGDQLTTLLAERFIKIQFTGIDSDQETIQYAKDKNLQKNLNFITWEKSNILTKFDMIIASEVIEHVESPDEFIFGLGQLLSNDGKIILTLPNGYGPFEFASFLEIIYRFSGLRKIIKLIRPVVKIEHNNISINTLANSPHINFFSYKEIISLIENSGYKILSFSSRTIFCGFIFDSLIKARSLINLNSKYASKINPLLCSAWMFVIDKDNNNNKYYKYRRGNISRIRRKLNEVRWK